MAMSRLKVKYGFLAINKRHYSKMVMAGGAWGGICPLLDRQGREQGGAQGGLDTQGQGREGQCHCRVREIRGNLQG